MKLAQRVSRGVVLVITFLSRILLVRTAVRLVAFFKLLVEVAMLLLFLLCYYAGGCVVFVFVLVKRGLLAPLIVLVLIIVLAVTPRPFL